MCRLALISQGNHARIVHDVENGASVQITRRGRQVAILLSVEEDNRLTVKRQGFSQALEQFRQELGMERVEIESEIFAGVRDRAPGREVAL
ncbi:MAG: hypothetical protein HC769_05185 [Cyanobacteria bacterium CRU_2_1]|nr:hypothetical protein [Cyanobacteria bacterium CRU_2_1]